jgi:hypothetical protein
VPKCATCYTDNGRLGRAQVEAAPIRQSYFATVRVSHVGRPHSKANVDIVELVLSADRRRARAFGLTDAQTDHTAAFEDVLAFAAGELDAARYQAFRNLQ